MQKQNLKVLKYFDYAQFHLKKKLIKRNINNSV